MKKIITLTFCLLFVTGCSNSPAVTPSGADEIKQSTWHYQLQDASFENLKKLSVKYLVIDVDDAKLSPNEIARLRQDGKKVLSYLSIGEAENYRDYWQNDWATGNPNFIDAENPDWEGNYKVKYWHPEWQATILRKVQKIANQGFDGVYLDIIDAYEYYEDAGVAEAKNEMINFVKKISELGKLTNKRFLVIPQNAPELYLNPVYSRVIDGIGAEDTWYDDDAPQDTTEINNRLQFLDKVVRDGKLILSVDYPTTNQHICDFYTQCKEHGFSCTVSTRDLDKPTATACR